MQTRWAEGSAERGPARRSRADARVLVLGCVWIGAALALAGCGRSTFQNGELGAPCISDEACQEGLVCQEGFCRLDDTGGGTTGPGTTGPDLCDQGLVTCLNASTRGVCGPDGYTPEPCPGDSVCQDGACVSEPTCEDGARICDGPGAVLFCEDGAWGERVACRDDQRCSNGICQRVTQAADIRVDAVAFSPNVLERASDGFELFVDVENVGERETGSFSCSAFAVDVFEGANYPIQEFRITTLVPGQMANEAVFVVPLLPPSLYEVVVSCDPFGEVDEIDEGNNFLAAPMLLEVLDAVEEEVDVELQFFNIFPNRVLRDGVIQVEYQVGNIGPSPLEFGYACDVYLERGALDLDRAQPVGSWFVDVPLFPFESFFDVQSVDLAVEVLPGSYNAYLNCLPIEQADAFLGNNLLELPQLIEVDDISAAPDLVVADLFVESGEIEPDAPLDVYTLICNQGTTGVDGASIAYLLFEDPFGGGLLDDEIAVFDIGPMGPGSCEEFFIQTQPVACFDAVAEQELFVQASIRQVFGPSPEVNINNNFLTAFSPAILRGCDEELACEPDLFDLIDEEVELPQDFPLSLCDGDEDLFLWPIEVGREVELEVNVGVPFEPIVVTVEVDRGGGLPEPLFSSLVMTSPTTLLVEREADLGAYYVHVTSASGEDVNTYTLSWRYTDSPLDGPDLVGEVLVEPGTYAPNAPLEGSVLVTNIGDAAAEAPFSVVLQLQDAMGVIWNIGEAFNPGGLGEGNTLELGLFGFRVPGDAASGPAELRAIVDSENAVEESNEGNNVAAVELVISEDEPCGDAFDPNNRREDAVSIDPGDYALELCFEQGVGSREQGDFFRVCPEPGTSLEVLLSFNGDLSDVDLRVESDDGQQRDSSISTGDVESVRIDTTRAGQCYTVQVYLFGSRSSDTPYTMTINYTPLDPGPTCQPDAFEAVDAIVPVPQGEPLSLCEGDEDTFVWPIEAGVDVELTVGGVEPGPIRFAVEVLVDFGGGALPQVVETFLPTEGSTTFVYQGDPNAFETFLRVFPITADEVPLYSLTWRPLDAPGCLDADEPNGTFEEAFELEAGGLDTFDLCQRDGANDVDIFAVVVPEGSGALNVTIVAQPDQEPGAFALGVYDAEQRFITQRFAATINTSFDVPGPGLYYLRLVTSSDAEVFRYDLSVSFEDAP